ncbi:hypothetical protein ACFL6O_03240 [candidate division KSB1 bacterium]
MIKENFSRNDVDILYNNPIIKQPVLGKECKTRNIIFKEITEQDELIEMFALRSLVYQYVDFFTENVDDLSNDFSLDIDPYDMFSTFLGAFEISKNSKRLIGTLRIISPENRSEASSFIEDLYISSQGSESNGILKRDKIFPHQETFDVPQSFYSEFCNNNGNANKNNHIYDDNLYEISRLAVLPQFWKTKHGVEHGLHIMIALNAWQTKPQKNYYMIAVHPRMKRVYERIGFKPVPDLTERIYKKLNQPAILLSLDLNSYLNNPNPYLEICQSKFDSYLKLGYFKRGK